MAGIATALLGGGIEGAGKGIAMVVNAIRGRNPEDAAKLQELLTKHEDLVIQTQADLAKAEMDANVRLNETAGTNIQTEAKQNWYTASARPSIIWCWIAIMLYNYVVANLIHRAPVNFPDMFWEISGVTITGYVFARTSDKLFGGAGGGVQLPFGIKLDSKGDQK